VSCSTYIYIYLWHYNFYGETILEEHPAERQVVGMGHFKNSSPASTTGGVTIRCPSAGTRVAPITKALSRRTDAHASFHHVSVSLSRADSGRNC
jgi:hypothetical protein